VGSSGGWYVGIDLETAVLDLELRTLINEKTEASLYVPFISYNSGFMDGALDGFHSTFGLNDYGRSKRPHDDFLFIVSRDGSPLIRGRSGEAGPGDLRAALKRALREGDPYLSLYGFIELPTGDPKRGFGNGDIDWGLSLHFQKSLGEGLGSYLGTGVVVPGDYRAAGTFGLDEYFYLSTAVMWEYSKDVSLVGQALFKGSPYSTGVRDVDTASVVSSLGGRYGIGNGSYLELVFTEDPSTAGAPDLAVGLNYILRY
jgi:hypothetical protein